MSVEAVIQAFLAAGVAGAYFTIAAVVVPRMHLEDAGLRYRRLFQLGAVAFFVGCGLTHLHITVHAITDPGEVEVHELLFHVAQFFGGWAFIIAAIRFLDISLVRRRTPEEIAATKLADRNRELSRSNSELARFAEVVNHDLKQPLRTINGFNGMLARRYADELDEKAKHYIDESMIATEHMADLLDGVLFYSKVGGDELQPEAVDCSAVAETVVRALAEQIAEAGAEVEVGPLPTLQGDRRQLEQVFQNLVSNAIKFNKAGKPRVEISALERDGEWLFRVADNGIGIEERHREKIFDIFRRLHTREDYPGTGAGLSIAAKVIERHGGRIWVEDGPGGKGTSLLFTLSVGPETEPEPADQTVGPATGS